ncbi:hypothetical protein D9619_012370 [Psilocybe cf. subviscida]|uniref:F-box domain-containing protein n=1 Tax=Psilocybe cf. subviscida TaxID=2480587 RepID=A0A8H5ASF1_9AGAR|nr:hypothetical protein D9619_012370 [Psilocybe cf. subviscida]
MDPTPQIRVSGAEHESVSRTHVARKELDDVENQLAELKARRSLLQADVNATTDPLTRQIPLEIASYIFELFLMAHIAEEDWPDFLGRYIPFRLTKPAAPLRLAAVCKQWRNIAWSLPQLWTTLVVDLHCKHSALGPEIVSQWLMRTKNLPLVIKIGTFGGVQKCSECITANGQAIIRTINRHASQWRLLDFTSLPSGLLQELDDSKSAGMETPSLLQYLLLGDDSDLPNSNGIPMDQLLRLSKRNHCPTHLRIASSIPPSQINIQWTHLTHLELSFCTVPASLAIISLASISPLRSLALVNFFGPSDEWWALSRPVVLPDLLFLSIDDPTPAGLISQSILNCLEVPSLTSLHLARDTESESSGDLPVASIISLLGRSNCMLHYFTLIHWPVSDSALVQLLNKTPTLTTLTIDLHWTSDPLILLNRLSQADFTTSHDPFLPNLQTLDLTSPLPVSWTPLIGVFDCSPADISDANHLIQQAPSPQANIPVVRSWYRLLCPVFLNLPSA